MVPQGTYCDHTFASHSSNRVAVRTMELNEVGKIVFGPRCETGTWGLQSLFEKIDPGITEI